MSEQPVSLVTLVDRLGKLEGLLIGLQNSIVQGQTQTTAFLARVERLETRQVELERSMVTKDDISALSTKVDALATNDARQQGGAAIASWSVANLAPWIAALAAVMALIGVGINQERQLMQTPTHPAPSVER